MGSSSSDGEVEAKVRSIFLQFLGDMHDEPLASDRLVPANYVARKWILLKQDMSKRMDS